MSRAIFILSVAMVVLALYLSLAPGSPQERLVTCLLGAAVTVLIFLFLIN